MLSPKKNSKNIANQNFDQFNPEESLKKGLSLKSDIFPQREIITPLSLHDLPEQEEELNNVSPTIKEISPAKKNDELKFFNLKDQIFYLAKKHNFKLTGDLSADLIKKIILTDISSKARIEKVPPLVAIIISLAENTEVNFSGKEGDFYFNKNNYYWPPMHLNEKAYKDAFPGAAKNIEMNINYGINVLKKLRKDQKTWSKAIVAYFMDSPLSIGKPDAQKIKALEGQKILSQILNKISTNEFKITLKSFLKPEDENDISYDLLFKELNKYKVFISEKYL